MSSSHDFVDSEAVPSSNEAQHQPEQMADSQPQMQQPVQAEPETQIEIQNSAEQEQATEPQQSVQPTAEPQANFSSIDNPVLAILAAREAEASAIRQTEQEQSQKQQVETEQAEPEPEPEPAYQEPELKPIEHEEVRYAHEVDEWASLIERSGLKGLTRQLALQSAPDINGNHIELTVKQDYAHLLNDKTENELYEVISRMAPDCEFVINKSEIAQASPAAIQQNINENRQERAEQSIQQDEFVQTLLNEFEGKLLPDSIKPL